MQVQKSDYVNDLEKRVAELEKEIELLKKLHVKNWNYIQDQIRNLQNTTLPGGY